MGGAVYAPEISQYQDLSTGFPVIRLTDPACSSYLPHPCGRFISRKRGYLIHASDRGGSLQAFRMDMKSGQNRQLTNAADLDPSSVTLLAGEKYFAYFDGRTMYRASMRNFRARPVYEIAEGYERGEGFCVSSDGRQAVIVEIGGEQSRIRLVDIRRRSASTVLGTEGAVSYPMPRPKRPSILFRGPDNALWMIDYSGKNRRRLATAPGRLGLATWAPDGRTVLYLCSSADHPGIAALREYFPDADQDRLVAETSQFVQFGANSDSSVFVGASGSRATPHILLLLRAGGRELALCEHRASEASKVTAVFSPDSRRIVFQSDGEGRPAIYSMVVDDFVEATDA
jgi:Tol biopolymer transport system component